MASQICVIGDSISAGVIFDESVGRYVHCPDSYIKLIGREPDFEIKNHSKFGMRVSNALARFDRFAPDIETSEYTLVMLGGNDSDYDWATVSQSPELAHEAVTPMETFTEQYNELLDRIKALGSKLIISNIMPVDGKRYFDWFSQKLTPEALLRFLHTTASVERGNEYYSVAVMLAAARRNLPLIDARSALLAHRHFGSLLCADGIHPSAEGHRAIFERVLPQLKAITG